ncbi:tripartite tricarboxylate transporter substrate binding protein [Acidovorax sp. CCYZU-2555]|uniref:Bug family tripartite tricarboxylate transporter substrate binding protein n=1 Tax=Acidovorax sp. CCYZU-2555 TaxID=2835042 RepID=UPI0020BE99AE|nr:tripartite tricarboxylate transporter substrate binding protein [Acidovorax sp. CCYZU-2555]
MACSLSLVAAVPAFAADVYPSKPITLVIPFPPGGATDVIGRLLGQKLGEKLGQPVIIDNRPGAGTIIGATYVAKAPADGYTLLASSGSTFTVNPSIRNNLSYDPIKSFDPIGIPARTGLIVLANSAVPVSGVKQFVDYVKASPGKYAFGSFGSGTTAHFAGELMLAKTGMQMTHVPYKGSAPAMTDLIGGQIPFSVDTVAAALPQLKNGKVKAIAVTTAKRSALLPDVPTFAEAGFKDIDMDTWLILVAPKGMPANVKAKLESTLAAVAADPEVQEKLKAQGFDPAYASSAAASALIRKEMPIMKALAESAHITAD